MGLLDRETGRLRYATNQAEESSSVTRVGPDGSIYIAHSPVRHLFTRGLLGGVLGDRLLPPVIGGVSKYGSRRPDLLARDAFCAAADRAVNLLNYTRDKSIASNVLDVDFRMISALVKQGYDNHLLFEKEKHAGSSKTAATAAVVEEKHYLEKHFRLVEKLIAKRDATKLDSMIGEMCELFL